MESKAKAKAKLKICMNAACGSTTSLEWKSGWALRSGGFASLCFNCGSAYENLVFCDTFHQEEDGWRSCRLCKKRLHCGCIASESLLELLEHGGVGCTSCPRSYQPHSILRDEIPNGFDTSTPNNIDNPLLILAENRKEGDTIGKEKLLQLGKNVEASESSAGHLPQPLKGDKNLSLEQTKPKDVMHPISDVGAVFLNLAQPSDASSTFAKPDNNCNSLMVLHQPLSIASIAPSEIPNFAPTFHGGVVEGREQSKTPSPFQQGQRSRPIFPKPSKTVLNKCPEANKSIVPQIRVARPPAEGRGRNQLLPRYWPKITDEELQQLSGDLNSTIVPLFEKVLSASDAGRIGRLVLPKACAEAYFPPISQSEGLPIRIQDAKGKEWTFQFRFWPNNNSRMYVLEGVTPCIQSMQLQAGDIVIFSRIDPGGKLVIGSRKASSIVDMQDGETSPLPNGAFPGEMSLSIVPTVSGYPGVFQPLKESNDPDLNNLSEHFTLADEDFNWPKSEKIRDRTNDNSVQRPMVVPEKKRTRNIGSKSKRLLMYSEDAMELRLTWEEAQDLLRPPPRVKPSIITIEDQEFEEYDEPPVFGKRTIFTARPSGKQEQWAQCDNCFKWRRLPVEVLLPPNWTCSDNVWDSSRCSCSAPDELSRKELENLLKMGKDVKRRRTTERSHKLAQEHEPSGLDALASAAVLGDCVSDTGDTLVGATTKHPRHRSGCTCIVCIQPPSGKGKHKPNCTCNVCMLVKRRFQTFMMRKKIRQGRGAVFVRKDHTSNSKDEWEMNGSSRNELMLTNHSENGRGQSIINAEVGETSTGQIDLNCQPDHEDGGVVQLQPEEVSGMSMMSLVQVASFPLENYLKQNGIASLAYEQQQQQQQENLASSSCSLNLQGNIEESEDCDLPPDENCRTLAVWEDENKGEGDDEMNPEANSG